MDQANEIPDKAKEINAAEVESFELFYGCYPRRIAKGAAMKAWSKLSPTGDLLKDIMRSLREQIRNKRRQIDLNNKLHPSKQKLIPDWPHPATWINGQRWMDDLASTDEINEKFFPQENSCECGKPGVIKKDYIWYCAHHYDRKYHADYYEYLYNYLKKMDMAKRTDETKEQYFDRCRKWCRERKVLQSGG